MTTAAARLAKQIKTAKDLAEANAYADRVLEMARAARGRKNGKATPRPQEVRREEHRASTGDLRGQVFARSGGKCEVSGVELGDAWELHHLRGAGARRSEQALENCLAVSWEVHRQIHRGDLGTLRAVKETCIRLGMRDGLTAIDRRLDKLEEARRV